MPQKIKMHITNNNNFFQNLQNIQKSSLSASLASSNLAITNATLQNNPKNLTMGSMGSMGSMITRIHNIKPGCGSCGRK